MSLSYVSIPFFALLKLKTGEVLGSVKLSSKKEVTNTNGAAGAVEAFNVATADVIKSLSLWINGIRN